MVQQLAFLISAALTLGVTALIVVSLWRSLQGILVDLCGTESRARFWRAYASIVLLLVPLTTLMLARPDEAITGSLLFAVIDQTRWALVGLIAALFMVALGVAAFIPSRTSVSISHEQMDDLGRLLSKLDEVRARQILRRVDEPAERRA